MAIKSQLLGEMGEQTVNDHFSQRNPDYLIVEFSEYYYSTHIMQDDAELL